MDFKNILSHLTQLSEATKETEKGRVHKAEPGGYGRKYDTDEEGDEKKEKKADKDAPKRGRGRPKKDSDETGEKKKYDTKTLGSVFGGKKPKKEVGKVSKKHSLKEWVEEVEQKYVAEMVPAGMKPLAILDPKNQQAGAGVVTSKNPAIQKMLGGLDPKDVQIVMTTQQQGMKPGTTQQPTATSGGATNQPAVEEGLGDMMATAGAKLKGLKANITKNPKDRQAAIDAHKGIMKKEYDKMRAAYPNSRMPLTGPGPSKRFDDAEQSAAMHKIGLDNNMEEATGDYSAKKARAGKDIGKPGKQFAKIAKSAGEKYGSKERGEKVAGAVLAKLRQKTNEGDIPSDQVDMGAGLGAGRSQNTFEAAKPDYIDLDKDGNKKESMKKAAQDAKKKKKVDESMDTRLKAAHLRGKSHALAKEGYNCRYDDMEEARMYHEGYKEGLDECYGQVPIRGTVVGEEVPATVPGMADQAEGLDEMDMYEMDKTEYMKHKAKTTPGDTFKAFGQTMHDKDVLETSMFESWDKELNSLLTEYDTIQEGMTVSISKGQQGMPDSVSVTAQDQEADQLLSIIKSAGLGLFGGDAPDAHDVQSTPMSLQPADGEEADIDVVGDHDGMMALIKKVTGGAGEPDTVAIGGDEHEHDHDYEDEEGEEGEECEVCGHSDCDCDHDEKEQVDEVESEDQMAYEVAEDNAPDSGAEETAQEVEDTAQANQSAAEYDEANESEKLDEWANEAGQDGTDAQFETDIAFMTKVIAGGLNKEKSTGQTTIPVIPGQNDRMGYNINESIGDWKKLAGIK